MFGRLKVLFNQSSQLKEACARKDYSSIVKVSPVAKVITIEPAIGRQTCCSIVIVNPSAKVMTIKRSVRRFEHGGGC